MLGLQAYTYGVKRLHRRLTAWCALLAICFVQLATAAHACTLVDAALKVPAASTENASPCDGMGMVDVQDRSVLCLEHCKNGQQLVDVHSPVMAAELPVVEPILVLFAWDNDAQVFRDAPLIAPTSAPPAFASSSRLRI